MSEMKMGIKIVGFKDAHDINRVQGIYVPLTEEEKEEFVAYLTRQAQSPEMEQYGAAKRIREKYVPALLAGNTEDQGVLDQLRRDYYYLQLEKKEAELPAS